MTSSGSRTPRPEDGLVAPGAPIPGPRGGPAVLGAGPPWPSDGPASVGAGPPWPSDGPAALAALLTALHGRGMGVGVDDAARIARAFTHSSEWPKEKRVRILKALIARTEDERRLIDQLSQFLFLDAPHEVGPEWSRGEHNGDPDFGGGGGREDEKKTSTICQPAKVPFAPWFAAWRRSVQPRRVKWRVAAVALVAVAVLVWRLAPSDRVEPPPPTTTSVSLPPAPAVQEPVLPEPPPLPTKPVSVPPCPHERDWVDRVQHSAPLFAAVLGAGALLWLLSLLQRQSRGRRQEANVRRVAESEGPRIYRLDVPEGEPLHPLDPGAVRDAAFQLSAPRREVSAPWLAAGETVVATAKNLGLLSLRFARWREQTSLVVLEDVSTSMVKWPWHGAQLVEAVRRQGGEVAHYFFERSPARLYPSAELQQPAELDVVLCGHQHAVVMVVSDAAGFEPGYGSEPLWVRLLGGSIWLHPAPESLWGRGARWLAARLRVVAMSPEGLLRLGADGQRGRDAIAPPWEPPQVVSAEPSAVISAWRGALTVVCGASKAADDCAFWLLCAAALLQAPS